MYDTNSIGVEYIEYDLSCWLMLKISSKLDKGKGAISPNIKRIEALNQKFLIHQTFLKNQNNE